MAMERDKLERERALRGVRRRNERTEKCGKCTSRMKVNPEWAVL
jgi:hypothetical protein